MEEELIATTKEYSIGDAIMKMPYGGTLTVFDEEGEYEFSVVKYDAEKEPDA